MSKLEAALILFLIILVIVFLLDYVFVKKKYLKRLNVKKKNKKKNNELTEIAYLVGKFKLNKKELPMNKLLLGISFINGFIISFVAIVVLLINIHIIFQLIIGFILLLALIYSLYELIGRYLVKAGYRIEK